MLGVRTKLIVGFGGLVLVILAMSLLAEWTLDNYSASNRHILEEDLGSLVAIHQMRVSIENIDLSLQTLAAGGNAALIQDINFNASEFDDGLKAGFASATLPGERATTQDLAARWHAYQAAYAPLLASAQTVPERRALYKTRLLPGRLAIFSTLKGLFSLNTNDMLSAHGESARAANRAQWTMRYLAVAGGTVAALFALLVAYGIHRPIQQLTESAEQIMGGNLDMVVPVESRDEIGRLADTFNQMTERLRALRSVERERLVRTERTTQTAIDALPDAVIVLNSLARIEVSNQAAKRLFGLNPGTDLGALPDPGLAKLHWRILRGQALAQADGYDAMVRVNDAGVERFFLPKGVAIAGDEGQAVGALITLTDVTGLRRLDEMKNNLLSMVSHELKTPLMSIRMIFPMLLEGKSGPLSPRQRELLKVGREDAESLHHILQNLLDMARIEAGRVLMETRAVPSDKLIEWAVEPMRQVFAGSRVDLQVRLPGSCPVVSADAVRINHVLTNLLANALKYTPAGGRVEVGLEPSERLVEFYVSDTGQGIPREYLGSIFDKFFRVPGQTGESGTGLGLAIVKGIVEAHGGRVTVESEVGKGTTFRFALPRAAEQGVDAAVPRRDSVAPATPAPAPPRPAPAQPEHAGHTGGGIL